MFGKNKNEIQKQIEKNKVPLATLAELMKELKKNCYHENYEIELVVMNNELVAVCTNCNDYHLIYRQV